MYKVLVIAYYYPPMGLSGVQRTLKFTKYFKQYGWEPVVLTAGETAYYAHDYSLLKEAEDAEIRIVRTEGKDINSLLKKRKTVKMPREFVRKALSRISSFLFVPDNKKGWAFHAYSTAKELLTNENFDVIFVSAPPFSSINLAYKLKEEFEIPLVIDYRDLWLSNQYAFYPTPLHKVMHKKMEYRALKKADKVIAINRKMKEKIINDYQFLTLDDIYIIPQGYDPADFDNLKPEHRESKKMRIT
ncbi:MAG: glycosyltransferase, partial [Bacteroidota bacterium]|nr:glycosyltransferase [Bacteroidota bacterium]